MSVLAGQIVLHATEMSRLASASVARASEGVVHSVFRRCANITTASGDWLTVAVASFPQTPDCIIVNAREGGVDFSPQLCLEAGMAGGIAAGEISIPDAGVSIVLDGAKIFDTRREPFARSELNSERTARNLAVARDVIRRRGRVCELPEFQRRAEPALAALREGILSNNRATMRGQCEQLLGLGIGLTPSGDDILGGIAAGLFFCGATERGNQFADVLRELVRDGERTTSVSARSLLLCVDGEISGVVFAAAVAIALGGAAEVERAVSAVLEIGGTSGTETAQGLCTGLRLAEEIRSKQQE